MTTTTQQLTRQLGLRRYGEWSGVNGPSYTNGTIVMTSTRRRVGRGPTRAYAENWMAYHADTKTVVARACSLKSLCIDVAKHATRIL